MKLIKKITILAILGGLVTTSYASSQIKVICDRDGETVYLNGQFKTTCDNGEPVPMMAEAGKYTVVVKKDNGNGSYYYYKKSFRIGDGIQKIVEVSSNIHYTEEYYHIKFEKSKSLKYYWAYLKEYPNGKYTKQVKNYLDNYYWKKCNSINGCKTYISKVSWGIHKSKAKQKLEDLYYARAKKSRDIKQYKIYLKKYPHGKYSRTVNNIINRNWYKTFGINQQGQEANSVIQTKDSKIVIAGYTWSKGVGEGDVWIIKLDKNGHKLWDKTFGGKNDDEANSIIQTKDDGFVIAGYTESFGAGEGDVWIIKLDKNGNKLWDKTFGGKYYDEANSIIQTKDGGFVIAGYTKSFGAGREDGWLIKLDKNGNKLWDKTFGGKYYDRFNEVIQSKDGGIIAVGYRDGEVTTNGWILKLDKNGNKLWDINLDMKGNDRLSSIIQTKNDEFIVAGYTNAKNSGNYQDAWIIKLDKNGHKIWNKIFYGRRDDYIFSLIQTKDKGFIAVGHTNSKGAGREDGWLIKLDKNGNKLWDKTFGGSNIDTINSIIQLKDKGIILVGSTYPKDAEVSYVWVISNYLLSMKNF